MILTALLYWLAFGVIGTVALYIGYGFVMAAKRAFKEGRTQRVIYLFDVFIAGWVILLDALLNVFFYSFLMLDFRLKTMFKRKVFKGYGVWLPNLVTGRMDVYGLDPAERKFRRQTAAFLEALTAGKDMRGFHIKGAHQRLTWLD